MLNTFIAGISLYTQAFSLFSKPEIRKYVFLTGLISILLGIVIVGGTAYNAWAAYLDILAGWKKDADIWQLLKDLLLEIVPLVLWVLLSLLLYKNIVLIVCSPFMSYLSAAVEKAVYGNASEVAVPFAAMLNRTIKIALWSILFELLFTFPCLLLNFIPVVGSFAAAIALFFVQSYYAGANYSDFILERKGYNTADSISYIRQHKAEITGIGGGFVLLLFIPVLGLVIAPAAATISATLSYLKENK